ncbi:MAG: VWA domain-containing protein, partial [Victivallales bacterium]|nr:VWA domain-containing protein [Victivallales bacterium]
MDFFNFNLLWHLVWVLPLLVIIAVTAAVRREKILKLVLGLRHRDPEFVLLSHSGRNFRLLLFFGAVLLLFVAAARPCWGTRLLPFTSQGRDVMVLFDVSKSMLSQDVPPSRLAHAKWFIRKLVNQCPGDRFGLIAFAGKSFLECPLTSDKSTFDQYLDELDTSSIPVGGTNIQSAVETAIQAFHAAEGQHRAVLLITDGDELTGDSPKAVAQLKALGIPLLVVGVGDPLAPGLIPIKGADGKSTKFLCDKQGNYVKSALNETQLKKLAAMADGCYARTTAAAINISKVQQRIAQLIPKKLEDGKQTRRIERFYYPLLAGLALLLLWLLLSERAQARSNNRLKTGLNAII